MNKNHFLALGTSTFCCSPPGPHPAPPGSRWAAAMLPVRLCWAEVNIARGRHNYSRGRRGSVAALQVPASRGAAMVRDWDLGHLTPNHDPMRPWLLPPGDLLLDA